MAAAGRGSGTAESVAARLKRKYAANATKTHNTRARSQTHARSAAHNLGEAAAEMSAAAGGVVGEASFKAVIVYGLA